MNKMMAKGTLVASTALVAAMATAQNIRVSVDGNPVRFTNEQPQYTNGRVLVPVRGVFEELGATVRWMPDTRTVMAMRDDTEIMMRIGSRYATINGQQRQLDVPAQIINGSTMVPLRFLSETLGADVRWDPNNREVMIMTSNEATIPTSGGQVREPEREPQEARRIVLERDMVIPVTLNEKLSSTNSRKGDRFSATLNTQDDRDYNGLPRGSRIEGRVASVQRQEGNDPGLLELQFNRVVLPNGQAYPIQGSLISLDNESVDRTEEGVIRAKGGQKDKRGVYAGYGAGAGLILGVLTKQPIEKTLIGGVLGYLLGDVAGRQGQKPANVELQPGTEFGVRLDEEVVLTRGRNRNQQ